MCYPLWYVPERRDAHEPIASTQLSTASLSPTSLAISRPRTDATPSADTSSGLVCPAHLGDLATGHAAGGQDHPGTRLSGGAQ
jgi:hypothetical protein